MALITAQEFRDHFPNLQGIGDDTKIDALIAEADDLMAAYAGYPEKDGGGHTFEDSTYTLYVDRPSYVVADAICVCVHPIVSITSIHVDTTRVYGASTLLVASTDYTFDPRDGMIIRTPTSLFTWPTAWRGTKVVLVAGYATTPPGLRAIAVAATRHLWDLRNEQGMSSYSALGVSKSLVDGDVLLSKSVKDALLAYMTPCGLAKLQAAA